MSGAGERIGDRERVIPMRVIVCGVHRTGSLSMRTALRQLGFNDCYHMHTVMENASAHPQMWVRAIEAKYAGKGTFSKEDWDVLLANSQSCVDLPAALFGAELAEVYPDAKVIILNRDPEKWYSSALTTVWKVVRDPTRISSSITAAYLRAFDEGTRNWDDMRVAMSRLAMGYNHAEEKDKAIAWFKKQYQEYRDSIPPERRLEYRIQDGWEPLCEYLEVPVPKIKDEKTGEMVVAPFPRVNDQEDFHERIQEHKNILIQRANRNFFALVGKMAMAGAVGYGGYLVWRTRLGGLLGRF